MNINIAYLDSTKFNEVILDLKRCGEKDHEEICIQSYNDGSLDKTFPQTCSHQGHSQGILNKLVSKFTDTNPTDFVSREVSVAKYIVKFFKFHQEILTGHPEALFVLRNLKNKFKPNHVFCEKLTNIEQIVLLFQTQTKEAVSQLDSLANEYDDKLCLIEPKKLLQLNLQKNEDKLRENYLLECDRAKKSAQKIIDNLNLPLLDSPDLYFAYNDELEKKEKSFNEKYKAQSTQAKDTALKNYNLKIEKEEKKVFEIKKKCDEGKPSFIASSFAQMKMKDHEDLQVVIKKADGNFLENRLVLSSYKNSLFSNHLKYLSKKDRSIDLSEYPEHVVRNLLNILHEKPETLMHWKDAVWFLLLTDYLNLGEIYNQAIESLLIEMNKSFLLTLEVIEFLFMIGRKPPESLDIHIQCIFEIHVSNEKSRKSISPKAAISFAEFFKKQGAISASLREDNFSSTMNIKISNLDPFFISCYGLCCLYGFGCKEDVIKGMDLFLLLRSSVQGQYYLGKHSNLLSVKLRVYLNSNSLLIAAERGYTNAQFELSKKSIEILKKRDLSIIPQSIECQVAEEYLKKYLCHAVNSFHVEAMVTYATCLKEGFVFTINPKQAIVYYQKAIRCNNANAYFELGLCYLNGVGFASKETDRAFNCFFEANKLDHLEAKFQLAECYQKGVGVLQDRNTSLALYTDAAFRGHEGAKKFLESIGFGSQAPSQT